MKFNFYITWKVLLFHCATNLLLHQIKSVFELLYAIRNPIHKMFFRIDISLKFYKYKNIISQEKTITNPAFSYVFSR